MKPAWYEPNLCMCTPENPNTMGVCVTLTEPVNVEALRSAVERLRERFPYLYVRARVEGNNLIAVPNPLPVTVRNTWEPILLNSEAANYHMLAFKVEENRLCAEVCHSITDGVGFLPYFKSLLYCYLSDVTGQRFDPEGFRLPGQPIPEAETGNPFADLDLDAAEAPLYQKPPISDFYRFPASQSNGDAGQFHYLRLPEAEVMRYCRENDGSPNVLMSVLLAKAIRRIDPGSDRTVTCVVAVDHKAQAGNHENYRMFVDTVALDMPVEHAGYDIMKACTKARGQLMLQAQPENTLFTMKTRKLGYERMEQMPLQMCVDMVKNAIAQPRATVSVSYADSRSFGPLDGYIRELYVLSEPLYVTDIMCEIACINHCFFLSLAQKYASEAFVEAFLAELDALAIPCEVMRSEPFHLCGVRYDGLEGVTL
jgi:hypothetical protein